MATSPVVASTANREPIASLRHTLFLIFILAFITIHGFHLQHQTPRLGGGEAERHRQAAILAGAIIVEWLLVLYIWFGVKHRAGSFKTLILGSRKSWQALLLDIAIAAPFWFIWRQAAIWVWHLVGPSQGPSGPLSLPPEGALNIGLWFVVSMTAGFAEELIYRGYLQKQIQAFSGSVTVAVIAQAILFGFGHSYQGMKAVFVISILGLLYGLLAAWRKNLVPGMVSHAWSDIYAGYVGFLL